MAYATREGSLRINAREQNSRKLQEFLGIEFMVFSHESFLHLSATINYKQHLGRASLEIVFRGSTAHEVIHGR
jgi:hypothetical protein